MAVQIPINLASTPFRRDRPLFVASVAVCTLLAIVLFTQIGTILSHRQQAAATRVAIERTTAQLNRIGAEQRKFEASPQFGPTTLVNSLPPSQTDPYFRYHVTVSYAQKL